MLMQLSWDSDQLGLVSSAGDQPDLTSVKKVNSVVTVSPAGNIYGWVECDVWYYEVTGVLRDGAWGIAVESGSDSGELVRRSDSDDNSVPVKESMKLVNETFTGLMMAPVMTQAGNGMLLSELAVRPFPSISRVDTHFKLADGD
jgi:hypothetical protein